MAEYGLSEDEEDERPESPMFEDFKHELGVGYTQLELDDVEGGKEGPSEDNEVMMALFDPNEKQLIEGALATKTLRIGDVQAWTDDEIVCKCRSLSGLFKLVKGCGSRKKYCMLVFALCSTTTPGHGELDSLRPAIRFIANDLRRRQTDLLSPSAQITSACSDLAYYKAQIDYAASWLETTTTMCQTSNAPTTVGSSENAFFYDDDGKLPTGEKATDVQKLIFHLINELLANGYCIGHHSEHKVPCVYKRMYSAQGHFLHTYTAHLDLHSCLWDIIGRQTHLQVLVTKGRSFPPILAEFLQHSSLIPSYKPSNHKFSFIDGVFDAHELSFQPHATCDEDCICGVHIPHPFPIEALDETTAWQNVQTPLVRMIMDYQGISDESQAWIYFMMGRFIHPECNLQVALALVGLPSTGKSLLSKIIQAFLAPVEVGTVQAHDGSTDFMFQAVFGKAMFVIPEPMMECKVPVGHILSLITKEPVLVNQKHIAPVYAIPCQGHGLIVANVFPKFRNEDEIALMRRIVPVLFQRPVARIDTLLEEKILKGNEFGRLVVKCARAYKDKADELKRNMGGFWHNTTSWFRKNRLSLLRERSPLYKFLDSEDCKLGADLSISEEQFILCYKKHMNVPAYHRSDISSEAGYYSVLAFCNVRIDIDEHTRTRTLVGVECRN